MNAPTPKLYVVADPADAPHALLVVERLASAGLSAWYTPLEGTGQHLDARSLSTLQAASAVILIFSSRAAASRLVDRSLLVARQHAKPVIHVRLENVDEGLLRQELLDARWIDWREPDTATAAIVGQAYALQRSTVDLPEQSSAAKKRAFFPVLYMLAGGALVAAILTAIMWIPYQNPPPSEKQPENTSATAAQPTVKWDDLKATPEPSQRSPTSLTRPRSPEPSPSRPPTTVTEPAPIFDASPRTYRTSYNCARAATATERAVCADPVLASMDVQMAAMYQQRRRQYPGAEGAFLVEGQRAWLFNHGRCGASYSCLRESYRERIDTLMYIGD